jgi:hypothetical protein
VPIVQHAFLAAQVKVADVGTPLVQRLLDALLRSFPR